MFSEALEIFDFLEIREVIIPYAIKEHKQHTAAIQNVFPPFRSAIFPPRLLEKTKKNHPIG